MASGSSAWLRKSVRKARPCLRCGWRFITPPEVRICDACKKPHMHYVVASRGLDYNPTFSKPINTRHSDERN